MTEAATDYDILSAGLPDLAALAEFSEGRVRVGRVFDREDLRVRTLAIPAGVTLTEHVAGAPVLIHVVAGRVRMDIGGASHELGAGALVRAGAAEAHEVHALDDARLLLTLHPAG